jgi:hypothetical protein
MKIEKKNDENQEPPPRSVWGWSNHLHAQEGGPATPKRQKQNKTKKKWVKMGFGLLGVAEPPPQGLGLASTTLRPAIRVASTTTDLHLHLLFFFFFSFKKKRINGQNDVVLGWVGVVVLELKTV